MHDPTRRSAIRLMLLAALSLAASMTPVAAETPTLAIKGYDPVAYFTLGAPVRGVEQIEYVWDEQRYRFSRPEHRDLFKADPARYAPQFANICTMAVIRGKTTEANPELWLISDGRLYLFGKREGLAEFKQDLAGNIAKANQNWAARSRR
jgi:hypothetical protein